MPASNQPHSSEQNVNERPNVETKKESVLGGVNGADTEQTTEKPKLIKAEDSDMAGVKIEELNEPIAEISESADNMKEENIAKEVNEARETEGKDNTEVNDDTKGNELVTQEDFASNGKDNTTSVKLEEEEKDTKKKEIKGKKEKVRKATSDVEGEPSTKRSTRERKSADAFKPYDSFVMNSSEKVFQIIPGRGTPLEDIEPCKTSIEKTTATADVLVLTHKLLFSSRGKPNKKDIKKNILKFNGFLPANLDPDPKKQHENEMDIESKMGQKAYKLKIPELRQIADLFALDRSSAKDKDSLVDLLLDFLGEPNEAFYNSNKGTKAKKKMTSRKPQAEEIFDEENDNDKDEQMDMKDVGNETKAKKKNNSTDSPKKSTTPKGKEKSGKMPNDSELRKWVNHFVNCHNMEISTVKYALQVASEYFGVDVTPSKSRIKELLAESLLK